MAETLTTMQTLLVMYLVAAKGGDWLKGQKGTAWSPANRRRLRQLDLVEESKRKAPGARTATLHYALTEEGWAWAAEHLDADLPPRALVAPLLQRWLTRLGEYLAASGVSLAEVVTATGGEAEATEPATTETAPVDLAVRVREAYFEITGGRSNARVRLSDLRPALADVDRTSLDEALLGMAREGSATLFPLDDPQSITAADREAVLLTPVGDPRHLLYIER